MADNVRHINDNDDNIEFSFIGTLRRIRLRWKFLVKVMIVFAIFGLGYSLLFTPTKYKASATLLPLNQVPEGQASKLLSRFGGLAGLGGASFSGEQIPTDLYPNILNSTPCQLYLLDQIIPFSDPDTSLKVYDYLSEYRKQTIGEVIKSYTVGLPDKFSEWMSSDSGSDSAKVETVTEGPMKLSKKQIKLMKRLRNAISVKLDDDLGTVAIVVEWDDPKATAALTDRSLDFLMEYAIAYKIEKEQTNLAFIEERYQDAENRFHQAQQALARYDDENQNIAMARVKTERDRLQAEYNLTFDLYNGLAQQLENARIRVQEKTPAFKILEPVIVPTEKSSMRKKTVIMISVFLGLMYGLFRVMYGAYLMAVLRTVMRKN